jgi:hypothetical protein
MLLKAFAIWRNLPSPAANHISQCKFPAFSLVLAPSKNVENWPTYLANRLQSKAIGSIFDRIRVATSGEIFLWTSNEPTTSKTILAFFFGSLIELA